MDAAAPFAKVNEWGPYLQSVMGILLGFGFGYLLFDGLGVYEVAVLAVALAAQTRLCWVSAAVCCALPCRLARARRVGPAAPTARAQLALPSRSACPNAPPRRAAEPDPTPSLRSTRAPTATASSNRPDPPSRLAPRRPGRGAHLPS